MKYSFRGPTPPFLAERKRTKFAFWPRTVNQFNPKEKPDTGKVTIWWESYMVSEFHWGNGVWREDFAWALGDIK